jgi:ribosomal-protein-alanine N-acetyltransferase
LRVLETERLVLRHLSVDDARFMLELMNEPSYIRFIGDRKIRSIEGARVSITNGPIASYAKNGFGLYLVELKETGEAIGICGLIKRDVLQDVDIGYAFLPKFWLKGYAIESAMAVKNYARDVLGLTRLIGITDPDNIGSIRVLERIGMEFKRMVQLSEEDIELKLYSVDLKK